MNGRLFVAFGLTALTCTLGGARLQAQNARVHIILSRPYTSADTTGLVHAPEKLAEVSIAGLPREAGTCAHQLRDAARNIDLLLIASFANSTVRTSGDTVFTYRTTYGDYAPKTRAYGLQEGELVRVDCARDRPVTRVRKSNALPDSR
jgi:hypothetical protein